MDWRLYSDSAPCYLTVAPSVAVAINALTVAAKIVLDTARIIVMNRIAPQCHPYH